MSVQTEESAFAPPSMMGNPHQAEAEGRCEQARCETAVIMEGEGCLKFAERMEGPLLKSS